MHSQLSTLEPGSHSGCLCLSFWTLPGHRYEFKALDCLSPDLDSTPFPQSVSLSVTADLPRPRSSAWPLGAQGLPLYPTTALHAPFPLTAPLYMTPTDTGQAIVQCCTPLESSLDTRHVEGPVCPLGACNAFRLLYPPVRVGPGPIRLPSRCPRTQHPSLCSTTLRSWLLPGTPL